MPRTWWRSLVAGASGVSLLLAPLAYAEPGAPSVHVVVSGETLSQIADDAGVDAAALASLNGLDDANVLSVGQSLKLPAATAPSAVAAPANTAGRPAAPAAVAAPANAAARPAASGASAGGTASGGAAGGGSASYTVADGDTLWDIAQRFSTTTGALVDANHLDDPDHLALGTQLALPRGAVAPARPSAAGASAPTAPPTTGSGATAAAPGSTSAVASGVSNPAPSAAKRSLLASYTVQDGETLTQIAYQFDVRPDAIAQASGLDDPNRLSVGTVLKVPLPGREHVVAAGETLRDIAAQEKVDLGTLIDFNSLDDPELIHVGQVVQVPSAPNLQAATSDTAASSKPPVAAAPSTNATATAASSAQGAAGATAPTAAANGAPATAAPVAGSTKPTAGSAASGAAGSGTSAAAAGAVPPKPAAPVAVVAPPAGSPTDGLAGAALKFLGSPYVWGGSSPMGFDCSGLVWYVGKQVGKPLSRGMFGEYNSGSHPTRDQLKPGDLVFFQNTYGAGLSHNGIYIGNNQFVHAADEAAGVTISSLGTAYWSSHWFGATRLP